LLLKKSNNNPEKINQSNDSSVYTDNYNSNKLNITAEILCKKEKNNKIDSTGGSNAN